MKTVELKDDPALALERRIAVALSSDNVSAADLGSLIGEVEAAIYQADQTAIHERQRALDPSISPDAAKAQATMMAAEFNRDRLHVSLPRIQLKYQETLAREHEAQWLQNFAAKKLERDERAAAFREFYQRFAPECADHIAAMAELDAELSQLHLERPSGVALHLVGPEASARGIEHFTASTPSIASTLHLPAFVPGQPALWPPAVTPIAAVLVQPVATLGTDADWWKLAEEKARRAQAERARWGDHYAREQATREAAER